MREKFKYLFKNTGYLFIGNFSSKILVFLLVPLYTSVLTTAEYGTYDLIYTTIQLLVPILSLNIIDSIMRFTIDTGIKEKKYVYCVAFRYCLFACIIFGVGSYIVFHLFNLFDIQPYFAETILFFVSYIFFQFITQFSRGLDDVKGISIAGIIGTVTVLGFNVLFLLGLKFGLHGYFWANILSFGIQSCFLYVHSKMHMYKQFSIEDSCDGKQYRKEMLIYCLPLIFNTLVWFINGAADRYTVTLFRGLDVNGIYSVAYKIPAILNAVQVVFIQAWQLSAIKEFNSSESNIFYKKTYQGIQGIIIVLCSLLIVCTRVLSKILFAADFYDAWRYVPILLTYIVFNTLSGTIGGVFSAAKDTKAFSISAITGASVNIVLNFVFVYLWGAMGAAIATVISSIVIWAMRMHFAKRHVKYNLPKVKYLLEYCILFSQACLMTCVEAKWGYIIQFALLSIIMLINFYELKEISNGHFINKTKH